MASTDGSFEDKAVCISRSVDGNEGTRDRHKSVDAFDVWESSLSDSDRIKMSATPRQSICSNVSETQVTLLVTFEVRVPASQKTARARQDFIVRLLTAKRFHPSYLYT